MLKEGANCFKLIKFVNKYYIYARDNYTFFPL